MAPRSLAAAALAALATATAACGESDEDRVRETLEGFESATARKDYRALCADVLSRDLIVKLRSIGLPCELALRRALGPVQAPELTIGRIRVRGDAALAQVTSTARGQRPSQDTIRLVKEGDDWRVSSLSGAQPPTPPRNVAGEREHE